MARQVPAALLLPGSFQGSLIVPSGNFGTQRLRDGAQILGDGAQILRDGHRFVSFEQQRASLFFEQQKASLLFEQQKTSLLLEQQQRIFVTLLFEQQKALCGLNTELTMARTTRELR